MSAHNITINRFEGTSRYGRRKRTFQAVCACGWEDRWEPVQRWVAVEHGNTHVHTAPAEPAAPTHVTESEDDGGNEG